MNNNKYYKILSYKIARLYKLYGNNVHFKRELKFKIYTYRHKFEYCLECRPSKEKQGYYSCDECVKLLEAAKQLASNNLNYDLEIRHHSYKNFSFFKESFLKKRTNRTMVTSIYLVINPLIHISNPIEENSYRFKSSNYHTKLLNDNDMAN